MQGHGPEGVIKKPGEGDYTSAASVFHWFEGPEIPLRSLFLSPFGGLLLFVLHTQWIILLIFTYCLYYSMAYCLFGR